MKTYTVQVSHVVTHNDPDIPKGARFPVQHIVKAHTADEAQAQAMERHGLGHDKQVDYCTEVAA